MNKRREAELIGAYSRLMFFVMVAGSSATLLFTRHSTVSLIFTFCGAGFAWVAQDTDRALRAHEEAHQEGNDDGEG